MQAQSLASTKNGACSGGKMTRSYPMAETRSLDMCDKLADTISRFPVSDRTDAAICNLLLLAIAYVHGSPADCQERARMLLEVLAGE
jgi:hypothetical protein